MESLWNFERADSRFQRLYQTTTLHCLIKICKSKKAVCCFKGLTDDAEDGLVTVVLGCWPYKASHHRHYEQAMFSQWEACVESHWPMRSQDCVTERAIVQMSGGQASARAPCREHRGYSSIRAGEIWRSEHFMLLKLEIYLGKRTDSISHWPAPSPPLLGFLEFGHKSNKIILNKKPSNFVHIFCYWQFHSNKSSHSHRYFRI